VTSHRIHTIELEFEVGEVALAEALSERLSRLHERRLAAMLDRVCSELSGPERLDRIDTLELDLGSLEPGLGPTGSSEFDDEFMRKLEAALRSQLRRLLGESRTPDAAERAALELLETYARTGNLPWWADRRDPDPVAAQLRLALARAPESLFALLRALADDALGLARLARRCDPAWIDALALQVGGAELLVDLRGRDPQARVAMMTAYADVEVAVRAFRAGASDFLEKPFDHDELHRVARDVLQEGGTLEVPDLKIETAERLLIVRALAVANGSKTRAAELLGINRATLYNKLKAYGLGSAEGDTDSLKKPDLP